MIFADQNLEDEAAEEYERLITFDPKIKNIKDAKKGTDYLLTELNKLRK